MRAVIQRVKSASVEIDGKVTAGIETGFLALLGVAVNDSEKECDALLDKLLSLRIFEDENGKMNLSLADIGGSLLVVSQFTLYADCSHGRRPSFIGAARPETAVPLYERFLSRAKESGLPVKSGRFGADMQICLQNDGPVTIILDTDELVKKS